MSSKHRSEERVVEITQRVRTTYRVFIADRDSMSRDLLAKALACDSRYEAFATPPSDLLRLLSTTEVDVLIVGADPNSDSGSALELASAACRAHPNMYVVILLNQTKRELVINAFRIGARGVFSRERPIAEFLDCVEHVGKGFIWAGKREATVLLDAIKNIPASTLLTARNALPLTARELQTVQCAIRGKTNRSIASELGLSEHTVKNYLFRAFEKLGVSSRVELLLYLTARGYTFSETVPKALDEDLDAG